jgi:hypothetical protein
VTQVVGGMANWMDAEAGSPVTTSTAISLYWQMIFLNLAWSVTYLFYFILIL